MAKSLTRRDFFKSAAATAVVAAVTPPWEPVFSKAETLGIEGEGPVVTDLQLDLEESIARHKVVGANAAVYHKGSIETAAAGMLNVTTGVEVTHDTVMHIGSITKTINTTLVMQLVDDGLVKLEDPVIKYLPEFRVKDPAIARAITVKMLLNHTSGIDGELLPDFGHDEETIAKMVARAADMGKIHDPGKDCSYCNTAMVVAGYLAQQVRGESWYSLVKKRIFIPLGLENAIVLPADALLHRATVGHFRDPKTGEQKRTSHAFLPLSFAPAGSTAMMSARDLVTFGAAHIGNGVGINSTRILSEASAKNMQTRTAGLQGIGRVRNFGLGWMLGEGGDIGHGGGGPGILSWLSIHPEKDFAMAVLTNSEHGMQVISEMMNAWMKAATGVEPLSSKRLPYTDIDFDPLRYVGTYENISLENQVMEQDGGLAISFRAKFALYDSTSTEKTPEVPLKPVGDHAFAIALPGGAGGSRIAPQTILTFVNPMADGRMEHVATGGRLYRRTK